MSFRKFGKLSTAVKHHNSNCPKIMCENTRNFQIAEFIRNKNTTFVVPSHSIQVKSLVSRKFYSDSFNIIFLVFMEKARICFLNASIILHPKSLVGISCLYSDL